MIQKAAPVVNPFSILGVNVHPITVNKLNEYIANIIKNDQKASILNVNVHCLNLAYKDTALKQTLNKSDLVFCDGAGVILGAKILGYQIPERITYADWMWDLAKFCAENNFSLFFLGAKPGIAQKAAKQLLKRFPDLQITGVQHGYFNKSSGSMENEAVIEKINAAQPNILVLGFGMPMQEHWLMENADRIKANIFLTGGAVFDYISGNLNRAPGWMTGHGMEWLGRMIIEPRRLWKRYLLGNPIFIWRVLLQRLGLPRFPE